MRAIKISYIVSVDVGAVVQLINHSWLKKVLDNLFHMEGQFDDVLDYRLVHTKKNCSGVFRHVERYLSTF